MLHFYNVTYGELMQLPIYALWEMHKNINSIMSAEDLRVIRCLSTVMNPKAGKIVEMVIEDAKGLIVDRKEPDESYFDKSGFEALKAKIAARSTIGR